jgi:type I restriction enzyme S subunit
VDKGFQSPKFYIYFFQSKYFRELVWVTSIQKSAQPGFNIDDLTEFKVFSPPLSEQTQIVSYLDRKTEGIDNLIQTKVRKIELLKEYRTSLISKVVTKGLNPNVEMKDSGVEWIGEIPSHWYLNKVGNNTYVKGRIGWKGLRSEDFIDEGPFLITGTDFNKDGTINWEKMYHVNQERYDEDPFIQLEDNDVLITKDGTIGKVVFVGNLKGTTCLNSGIFLTRPTNNEYLSRYFYWMLLSNVFKVFVDYNSGGSTIQHLYQNVFVNFKFPIPPLSEQTQIVSYLDEQTQLIDKNIQTEEKKIELLKEYRQSLISEVVTGKIKVCNDEEVN